MSTRYVWEMFSLSHKYILDSTSETVYHIDDIPENLVYLGDSYTLKENTGNIVPAGNTTSLVPNSTTGYNTASISTYPYAFVHHSSARKYNLAAADLWVFMNIGNTSNRRLVAIKRSDLSDTIANPNVTTTWRGISTRGSHQVAVAGSTSYGYITSDNYNKYQTGEGDDGRYYRYTGSDNIDASAVAYSTDKPERNKSITITVTPGTDKKYDGTVYYQYYYSANGSSWLTLGSKTTDTSKTMTVPADAKSFQVRVLASDDLGFTSTTYVTGAKLTVQSIQAYVGVGNTARRAAKMYIGVNGVAREVTAGYVGDASGKARKWF